MFRETIAETAMTTSIANTCFDSRIFGESYRGDVSLIAAARVWYDKRLKDGERIHITHTSMRVGDMEFQGLVRQAAKVQRGDLKVVDLSTYGHTDVDWKAAVKSALAENEDLFAMDALEKWFETGSVNALVYLDRPYDPKIPKSPLDSSRAVVFVERLTVPRWHMIGGLMPRLLNDWFREQSRTQEETALANAFLAETKDPLLKAFADYAATCNFRELSIRNLLQDFETKFAKQKVSALERSSQDIARRLDELYQEIGHQLRQREDILAMLWGYQQQVSKEVEPETMNYFLASKNLYLQDATQDMLDFYVEAWFTNWDPEKAETLFREDGRCSLWLMDAEEKGVATEDAMLIYRALFLDETIRVKLWSHFCLALRGEDPMSPRGDFCIPDIQNAIPNPHHHYNLCGGANRSYAAQCIARGDIVGAIEQCVSATAGINLMEHASYSHFVQDLFNSDNGKIIYLNDKQEFVTTAEAIVYLKEKQGEAQHKEEVNE